jgi:hypothetical protein
MDIWAAAAEAIITDGAEDAAITTAGAIAISDLCLRQSLPGRRRSALFQTGRSHGRGLFRFWNDEGHALAQTHLDRDPDQVGVVFCPQLLLQQGGSIGNRLV